MKVTLSANIVDIKHIEGEIYLRVVVDSVYKWINYGEAVNHSDKCEGRKK